MQLRRYNQDYRRPIRQSAYDVERNPDRYSGSGARQAIRYDAAARRADGWDRSLRQAVRESLWRDDFVDADAIHVEVNDGVVTLAGEVEDFLTARYAWDDAWETEGVRGVVSQLTVRTDPPDQA